MNLANLKKSRVDNIEMKQNIVNIYEFISTYTRALWE